MCFFCPSEGLPHAIDLLVLEGTKLECYSAQLWYITEGTELIWQTQDENGSQVLRGTRCNNNGMIQPCYYVLRLQNCLSVFVVTL